ncbi:MAG: L-seryl-tRNA(Sec) selenium transferase [Myxococcales bacterium]|nr:L-seryl-tRNA(Sec) selenium transferase [Myxococcales bacterium]
MERLRALPSIDELLARPAVSSLLSDQPRPLQVRVLREAVASARARLLGGEDRAFADADVAEALARLTRPHLRKVLNATGVVLHTNLGRAPLAERAVERIAAVARGYCNLELDLDEGERGSRYVHVVDALCALTGAEAALVVNNCAAAVLLALSALAQGRQAVVSRGELVEIGGGFRVPDVMHQSGATLVEVGTTNRTRLVDYARAMGPETGLLVKVHRSNFAVVGFTEEVGTRELAGLARERGVPLYEDLGSGALLPLHGEGLTAEPTVASIISAGADLVSFSGDKLLGGPQAGVVVGKQELIARLEKHPLDRALRVDKLTVAALEATLELYRDGKDGEVPARALLAAKTQTLHARAKVLATSLEAVKVRSRVVQVTGRVGGGSMPLAEPPSWAVAVAVEGEGAAQLHDRLRAGDPPVVARIADDEVWLDVRCLSDADVDAVARCVVAARERTW